jgi:hypothetical protein
MELQEMHQKALNEIDRLIEDIKNEAYIFPLQKNMDKIRVQGFIHGLATIEIITFAEWQRLYITIVNL